MSVCDLYSVNEGVENAKADSYTNKVTVIGKVDPSMLREKLEQETKKKVELLSSAAKKDKKNGDGGGEKKTENEQEKKEDDKKPTEPVVTTAVLKIDLHCARCIDGIQGTVSNTKGVESESIDEQKNLVTVTGTMDVKALVESLKDRLKRPVEIVPPKKDAGGGSGGEKKGKDGDKKKEEKKEEGREKKNEGVFTRVHDWNRVYLSTPVNAYAAVAVNAYAVEPVDALQMFSDENPNACSIM